MIYDAPWYFLSRPSNHNGGFISFAKKEPFGKNFDPVASPGDLWFEFAETEEMAIDKLRKEVEQISPFKRTN